MARTGRPPKAKVAEEVKQVNQGLDLISEALEVITLCEYRGYVKQDVVNAALYKFYKTDQKTQDALIKTVQSKQTKEEVEDAKEEASDEVQSSDMEEAIEGGEDTLEEVIRSIQ